MSLISDVGWQRNTESVFFLLQRRNGHWSPDAKIVSVFDNEKDAEEAARRMGAGLPHTTFGVAVLRSEARHIANPIEIVKVS